MGSKEIEISEKAYSRLDQIRSEDESFDEVILRLLRYHNLSKHKEGYNNPLQPLRFKEKEKKNLDKVFESGNQFRKY